MRPTLWVLEGPLGYAREQLVPKTANSKSKRRLSGR
jgi:hypothetical protein